MVFNVVYGNVDDHLKNHSFIYSKENDNWQLSPAYDITFALNPLTNFRNPRRALSINGKRSDIKLNDILKLADDFTIKNPKGIVKNVQSHRGGLIKLFKRHDVPELVSEKINESIVELI